MGSLAQVVPWIAEDDLLLKNSVEAGASLQALAKGAVQFSRRFSIRELQDRWHSLLYDPVLSAEAAFRMTELELTNSSFATKFARTGYSKESKSSSRKRNAENLRRTYHSLRKRFRSESFNSLDLDFLVPSNDSHFMDTGDATHLGLEDFHMDIIHNAFPNILSDGCSVENHVVSEGNLQGDISYIGGENLTVTEHGGPSECDVVHQDSSQKLEIAPHEPKMASTLFKDMEPLMEVDGKEVGKPDYDGLSYPTNNTNSEGLLDSTEQDPSMAQTHPVDATPNDHVMPELDDTSAMSPVECKPVSDSYALDPHPEIVGGVINCVLNQEYPDFPCTSDSFLPNNCYSLSVSSLTRRKFKDTNNPVRDLSASRERNEGYSLNTQNKIPGRLQGSTQRKPEMGQPSQFRASTSAELHNTVSGGAPTCSSSAQACSNTLLSAVSGAKDGNKGMTGGTFCRSNGHGSYKGKDSENCKVQKGVLPVNEAPHPKDNGLIEGSDSELEISQSEAKSDVFESDEDLPNYSDIEAMILDMDLDPNDQDNFDLEVSKYQSQDMKRTIIRLEQAAYSYMQRAISSHGALAVLYGRYSKHYIKKPEVLVGRSTEDLTVDIDLGREKRGSKISRRQAIIQLRDDGFFHMKNLGKYAISVNETEVNPGQSLVLKSDCLVEIRGMPFIFETNQNRMKEYLKRRENGN